MASPRLSLGGGAALAAGVAVVAYLNAAGNGFALDDTQIVVNNSAIHSISGTLHALGSPYWPGESGRALGLWRPLTTLLLGLTWAVSGGGAFAFHAVNIALHAAASGLVVLVAAPMVPVGAATLAGVIFAAHPVHVEAVANVVGLGEVLSAALFLLACVVWTRRGSPSTGRALAVALLYAAAFLAKEGAVVLPAVLVLLDAARVRMRVADLPAYVRARTFAWAILAVTAAAVLAFRFVALGVLADPLPPPGAALLLEVPRIWTVAGVWPEYFRLLFFPLRLSTDYAPSLIPIVTVWTARGVLGAVLVLGALAGGLLLARRHTASPLGVVVPFALAWFCVTIAPVSNVLFLSGVLLAERTLYLPSVAFAIAVGWTLWALPDDRRVRSLAAVALVALLGARTFTRNGVWESTNTVMLHLIEEHPESGRAQWALGTLLDANKLPKEAHAAYASSLWKMNGSYGILIDVGRRLMNQGHTRAATTLLERGLETPAAADAATLLAVIHSRDEKPEDAGRWAGLAVMHNPDDDVAWTLRSSALEKQGEPAAAADARARAIRAGDADRWQAWLALARLRRDAGDSAAAMAALDTARIVGKEPAALRAIDSLWTATTPTP